MTATNIWIAFGLPSRLHLNKKAGAPSSYDDDDAVFFPSVGKISYKGEKSLDPFAFRYYNKDEVIMGKTMGEWCRFSVCFWHTFRGKGADPFGFPTISRPWDDETETLANQKNKRKHPDPMAPPWGLSTPRAPNELFPTFRKSNLVKK